MLSDAQKEIASDVVDAVTGTNNNRTLLQAVFTYARTESHEAAATTIQRTLTDDTSEDLREATLLYTGQDTSRYGTNQFTKVLVHASVEAIAEKAFEFWHGLKEVEFMASSSLKRVEDCAFLCCASLENIELPATVTFIGKRAFRETGLRKMQLPSVLESISEMAFASCVNLSEISIPSSVKTIDERAFHHAQRLERVSFESTSSLLEHIGNGAFENTALRELTIPMSVKTIGDRAFAELRWVKTIKFEEEAQVRKLGSEAFYACDTVKEITVPASVETMDGAVFACMESLEQIVFQTGSKLENIPEWAFDGCNSLTKIEIPKSVKAIEAGAFVELESLKEVTFEPKSQLVRIWEGAFESCSQLLKIELPVGTTHIGEFAFVNCRTLRSIVLPASVVDVGSSCFSGCEALNEIAMSGGVTFGNRVFYGCNNVCVVLNSADGAVADPMTRRPSTKRSKSANEVAPPTTKLEAESPQDLLKLILDGSGRYDGFVASMFNSKIFTFEGLNRQQLELIVQRTIKSRTMQRALKDVSVERGPVFVLMLEGYMNAFWVFSFIFASDEFLRDGKPNQALNIAIFFMSGYFVAREVFQMGFEIVRYFDNLWNAIDLTKVVLVIVATVCMETQPGGRDVSNEVRYLLLSAGAVAIAGLVLFLRSTFLPFAEFVGGLIMIIRKLLPFLVVSTLAVFAFAYMYFTIGFDKADCAEKGFCDLGVAMLTTLAYFFSGPEQNEGWLDIVFGVVIVVILLNVLIAIVSDAWESSTEKATNHFWAYRIGFLAEVSVMSTLGARYKISEILSEYLNTWDELGNRRIRDSINWEAKPYIFAKDSYAEYVNGILGEPSNNVSFADHEKLRKMGSFQRDWYWATRTEQETASMRAVSTTIDRSGDAYVPLPTKREVITKLALFVLSIFLGFATFGLVWPLRFRESLFGFKVGFDDEDDEKSKTATEASVGALESRLEKLERNMHTVESKLDAILEVLQKKG